MPRKQPWAVKNGRKLCDLALPPSRALNGVVPACRAAPAAKAQGVAARRQGGHMVLDLVIIGLAITLEPLTIVAFILILGAQQGLRKGLAFILGWMACLVAVIALVVLVIGFKNQKPNT